MARPGADSENRSLGMVRRQCNAMLNKEYDHIAIECWYVGIHMIGIIPQCYLCAATPIIEKRRYIYSFRRQRALRAAFMGGSLGAIGCVSSSIMASQVQKIYQKKENRTKIWMVETNIKDLRNTHLYIYNIYRQIYIRVATSEMCLTHDSCFTSCKSWCRRSHW